MVCIVLIVLLITPFTSNAETIDVQIKGVDDGVKTTRQGDYKEAVLFAKREAIERAGVKIKSMTTVKDMVVNSDYIESQAEAVLLPGYNILDMDYSADGTYQIVLVGKIKTGQLLSSIRVKEIDTEGWRWTAFSDGTVLDKKTQLMWAAEDNGELVNKENALQYCRQFKRGGYSDWRLPTSKEIDSLIVDDLNYPNRIVVIRLITISANKMQVNDKKHGHTFPLLFDRAGRGLSCGPFVLPVRRAIF